MYTCTHTCVYANENTFVYISVKSVQIRSFSGPYFPVFGKNNNQKTQPAFTCTKLAVGALEQGVKYVQINNKDTKMTPVASF